MLDNLPRLPLGEWIEVAVDFLATHLTPFTRAFSQIMGQWLDIVEGLLVDIPPPLTIVALTLVAWSITRKKALSLFSLLGFSLVWTMDLWEPTCGTLTLVLASALLAVALGMPLGIGIAMSNRLRVAVLPFLDAMQTMPAFVYLIPAIPFFGLGKISALFATVIFAMPPAIRFTCLGIRSVPAELVECAESFGSTRWQRLFKLELPLAWPTIMAGVNQTVMLSLSMVVVAAMIGARGLGGEVWKAIQRLELGLGFEAGIGIVIVAVYLDRLLQSVGKKSSVRASTE